MIERLVVVAIATAIARAVQNVCGAESPLFDK